MDGVLRRRAEDLAGILNGIDTVRWNPEKDEFVPARFNAADLSGKQEARRALLEATGLTTSGAERDRPGDRSHLSPDRSEGVRPDRRGGWGSHGGECDLDDARER